MRKTLTVIGLLIVSASVIFFALQLETKKSPQVQNDGITILWAQWKPADYLQTLTKAFTEKTGIPVTIVQESWSTWQTIFFDEMKKKSASRFDMVIGDSQWLGKGASEGHYVELTHWLREHQVVQTMTTASMEGYSEFPKGSKHFWAVPVEGDAMGFSYRKDLFEDPKEQATFEKRYGYKLDVPKTWFELKDIAEHFYRPQQDLYGVLIWTEPNYDGLTMGLEALLWAWGSDLGDQSNYRVRGILNSPAGVDALEFYRTLNQYNNPEWENHYLDTHASSNQPMMDGRVAMAMGYFAIGPQLLSSGNTVAPDNIGFFACPKGPQQRAASLGGQGISIVSYTKRKAQTFRFLEWFVRDDVQREWARLGGMSCNKTVLSSEAFLNASPINRPFVESMEMIRDFWAVSEYAELLEISQNYWHRAVVLKDISAEQAMDNIAREWEMVFEKNGYYKE